MKKIFKLITISLMGLLLFSCNSPEQKAEKAIKQYLEGNYTTNEYGRGFKEINIKRLKNNIYRVSCTQADSREVYTQDVFDIELYSFENQAIGDSVQEYVTRFHVTNIVQDGTTISDGDDGGVGESSGIYLKVLKDKVAIRIFGKDLYSERKK